MNTVLVFAAHPDDELLGLGGTIRRIVNEGVDAHAVILAEGLTSRAAKRSDADFSELKELQDDARKAAKIVGYKSIDFCGFPDNRMDGTELLDIIKVISMYVEKYKPDTIFTHHHGDLNIDHRLTCEAVLTACRPVGDYTVKKIYAFETPSSTEWNYIYNDSFRPNAYFDISETFQYKVDGMACYRTESTRYPHPRSAEALEALAKYRGSNIGVKLAEAFELMYEIN
ncbi:MAG: PIG-L family deacetylase [Eubacterium sp.]|nr:PIG-L family deacetylase [Eubacterium sp.]